jgi:hypothetical protein
MKKYFKITLFEGANSLCDKLAAMAARANGGHDLTLKQIYTVAEGNRLEYPALNKDISVTLVNNSLIHIDGLRPNGDYEPILIIEEIESGTLKTEKEIYEEAELPE